MLLNVQHTRHYLKTVSAIARVNWFNGQGKWFNCLGLGERFSYYSLVWFKVSQGESYFVVPVRLEQIRTRFTRKRLLVFFLFLRFSLNPTCASLSILCFCNLQPGLFFLLSFLRICKSFSTLPPLAGMLQCMRPLKVAYGPPVSVSITRHYK